MELLIGLMLLIPLLFLLRRTVAPSAISPIYALVCIYLFVFVLGFFVYNPAYGGGGVRLYVSRTEQLGTIAKVFWILCAFVAGVLASAYVSHKRALLQVPLNAFRGLVLTHAQSIGIIVLAVTTVLLIVLGIGPANLWRRSEYLMIENQVATIFAGLLSIASSFVLGVAAAQRYRWCQPAAIFLVCVLMSLMAARATRRFAMLPTIFCLGRMIAAPGSRRFRRGFLISLVAVPFLMIVPLVSREAPEQGLATLPGLPAAMAELDWSTELPTLLNNVFISAPLTTASAEPVFDDATDYVLTGLNPLPGFWTDWYVDQVRINEATPFNAIGDLLRAGTWVALAYYFVIGIYFCRLESKLKSSGQIGPVMLLLIIISLIFTVVSLQYPLRSITRFIYYMLLLDLGERAMRSIGRLLQRIRPRRALTIPGGGTGAI